MHSPMTLQEVATLNTCLGDSDGLGSILPFYHPRKAQAMIDKATKLMEAHFGSHSIDKPNVTIHEAGHGVIARLVGYKVKNVGVWMGNSNQWAGAVEVDHNGSGKPNDSWLWREALVKIAGYVGESLSGIDHPTVTIHEKLACLAICRYFDELHGSPAGHHFSQALKQCQEALDANREILEEISWRLLATNRVSGIEISSLMEGAIPLPISPPDDGGNKNES